MKVLFAASEAAPFCKTGGLGDVAGSLPRALADAGAEVRVILPLYEAVPAKWRMKMKLLTQLTVPLAWRRQDCAVYELAYDGIVYYFIENEYYYRRRELYGHYDDGERFAFYSKAALDILPAVGFLPDVVHANDWQAALIPVYLRLLYAGDSRYAGIKTVFTIHNIQYQGFFPRSFLADVAGIDDSHYRDGVLAYDDGVNLMKAAIILSDAVTTVSPTYAQEIRTPYFGHGLDPVLRENEGKLRGVINGIDTKTEDPAHDPYLFTPYGPDRMEGKAENKKALQKLLGLRTDERTPLVAMVTRLAEHKGLDLLAAVFDELMNDSVQMVVLGRGEWRYEQLFEQWQHRYPGRISANVLFSADLASKIYAGADLLLMPSKSEPCGLSQMIAMRYGTVPIVRETGGLKDTVAPYVPGGGTGFTFANYNAHDMLYVIREALGVYADREAWDALRLRCMREDFSWGRSAAEYLEIYRSITG